MSDELTLNAEAMRSPAETRPSILAEIARHLSIQNMGPPGMTSPHSFVLSRSRKFSASSGEGWTSCQRDRTTQRFQTALFSRDYKRRETELPPVQPPTERP